MINSGVSFENCYNGINISGKVTGSNSGIYINADIGDAKYSTYGIY